MAAWAAGTFSMFAFCFLPLLFVRDPNHARWLTIAAYLVIWCAMESAFAIRFRGTGLSPRDGVFPGFQGFAAFVFTGISLFVAAISNASISRPSLLLASVCGLIGVSLRSWSIATLKQSFLDTIDLTSNQKIVTTGPYRYLRHPAEWGFLLTLFGVSLIAGGFVVPVFFVVMLPFSVARMILENRMLSKYG